MGFASKEQLQELMQYMGENIHVPQLVQHFDGGNIYSTEEQIVGCWIDGRPIYQKTIDCGALPNKTTKTIAHNISNIAKIIKIEGFGYNPSAASEFYSLPWVQGGTNATKAQDVSIWASNANITINAGSDYTTESAYVTLQYTKTTDAANSFNIAKENDYCMQERIIGTWKDDYDTCIIYRKTYKLILPSTGKTYDKAVETFNTNVYPFKVEALQIKEGSFYAASNSYYNSGSTDTWPAVNAYTDSSSKTLHIAIDGFGSDYYGVTFYVVVEYLKVQ